MNTEIASIEKIGAIAIFQGDELDPILKAIEKEVSAEVPDISTAKGRDRIKSMAHKVAKTKTALDAMGKNLVASWKEKSKKVDASRKISRDFLDNLKEEVRKPVTKWEQEEVTRIEEIEERVARFATYAEAGETPYSSDELRVNLDRLKAIAIDKTFAEYSAKAAQEKDLAISKLELLIESRVNHEAEQAELERLRVEAAEREQKDRDDAIAKQAVEDAAAEAKKNAAAERKVADDEIMAAREREETAEREKRAAEQKLVDQKELAAKNVQEASDKAEREKKQAIEDEQRRVQEAKTRDEQEKSRREADLNHRKIINGEALKCFKKGGLSDEDSKLAVQLIASKLIPHISINY